MSGSSASWCKETDEKINYTKLCRLLVDGGTQAVCSVFDGIHPPSSLKATLNANKTTLKPLKKPRGRVLSNEQWDKLYPPCGSCPKSKDFDITLLFVLLRNICRLPAPVAGWDVLPHTTDTTLQANLARIKYYRNNTIAHKPNTELNDADFKQHWQDISSALLSLGLCQDEIDDLKSAPLGEEDYRNILYNWYISDKDISTLLDGVQSAAVDIKSQTAAIMSDTTAIKSDTVWLPGIREDISQLKDIYSSTHVKDLLINQLAYSDFSSLTESLCKSFHPNTRQWILDEVKSHVYGDESQPCGMLIKAGPGMGKSSIAAKICQTHNDLGCLAGCHFFQFNNYTRNNPRLMLQSIARQMCDTVPGYREALESKLQTDIGKKITEMNSEELFTVLLEEPLQKLNKDDQRFVVVLDAIDECCSDFKYELLHLLKSKLSLLPFWLRFVITSRPSSATLEKTLEVDPEDPRNKHDLELFFTFKLTQIYGICDPLMHMVSKILVATKGLFLVAFFVIDFLEKNPINPISKIPKIFENGISSVYEKNFSRLKEVLLPFISEEERFYKMLEAIVATKYRIPIQMVYRILGLKTERDVPRTKKRARQDALNSFHSLFPVENDHVTAFHKTVVDWLTLQQDEVHDFIVRVEDGNEVLASECHNVLGVIRNGGKDLDKPLVLTDDEKFSLTYCLDIVNFTRNELSRSLTDCYILSALICFCKRYGQSMISLQGLPCFSKEMNGIFTTGVKLFSCQPKRTSQTMMSIFNICFAKHDENCLLNPQNFGRCLEFVVNAKKQVLKKSTLIELYLLRSFRLSNLEVKDIAVELEEDWNDESVIACERGFLLVQETDHNTVVKKYLLDGTCLAKKTFPGTDKMLCMSTDHRYIVVANMRDKGNIEILDAKTLNLVTSYQSPDNIRSCDVYGRQPWYVVIRCTDMIYVMEGETGRLVMTYANKLNKYVDVQAVGNQGYVLLGRPPLCEGITKDDADAFFMNEDGKLLEDSCGLPVPLARVHLKYLLFHLERSEWNIPIYPTKYTDARCSCLQISFLFEPSVTNTMVFCFSDDGLLFAYSDLHSIFIINTSDGTLRQRVWLGPGADFVRDILFVSQILLVVIDNEVIMFIDVQTNEIKHRFYIPNYWKGIFHALPNQEGHPFTLLTHCFTDDQCVQQYVFHNLDF